MHDSYHQSKRVFRYFMYDPFGIKNIIYRFLDFITPNKGLKFASFSHYKDPIDEEFFNKKYRASICKDSALYTLMCESD